LTGPPRPPGDPAQRSRRRRLVLLVALLTGGTLRLLQYAADRSLWLDEALVSESILTRGVGRLLREPLEYGQTAPAGFLLLQKASTALLGTGEHVLRLVPFLAAMAALLLFPALARAFVSRQGWALAVGLLAVAPFAVYYAGEAKPYALDLLAAVVVLLAAARVLRRPDTAALAALAAAGVVALWVSQPAVFVVGGVGVVLGATVLWRGDRAATLRLAAVGALWALAFAPVYAHSVRSLSDPGYMRAFWSSGFPDGPAWWLAAPLRLFRDPFGVFGEDPTPLGAIQQVAAGLLFAAGCAWMVRRGRGDRLALLLAPAALALLAAALRLYPFGGSHTSAGRVLLFLLPALVLLVAGGVAALLRVVPQRASVPVAAVAMAALLASPLHYAAVQVPHLRAEVEPLLAYAADEREEGDLLYVHYTGRAPFRYYAGRYGWTPANSVVGRCSRLEPAGYVRELETLRPRRLWVLFNDDRATATFDDRSLILAALEHRGARVDDQVTIGAALYLYDLTAAPERAGDFRPRLPTFPPDVTLACRGPWAEAG
jgi:hypothetical protein